MNRFLLILLLIALGGSAVFSQTVKWQRINSEAEFAVSMPEGSVGLKDESDRYLSYKAKVDNRTFLYRYINGNSLMVEMYDGDVEEIRDQLVWRMGLGSEPYKLKRKEDVSDVSIRTFDRESDNSYSIKQLVLFAKRLYVVQAHAASKDSDILNAMLRSMTVSSAGKVFLPNLPPGSDARAAIAPTNLVEVVLDSDPTKAFEGKPDSSVVEVYRPRPRYSAEAIAAGSKGRVTINVLFGANGKIIKVKGMSGDVALRKIVTASAEGILFLPAHKDGKPVSMWKVLQYQFEIS